MVEIDALRQLGRVDEAAHHAHALAAALRPLAQAYGHYLPECWCIVADALMAAGRLVEADAVVGEAAQWIAACADRHVPPIWRTSFLERNPFNRRVLRWQADRRLLCSGP